MKENFVRAIFVYKISTTLFIRVVFAHVIQIEVSVAIGVIHHDMRPTCLVEGVEIEIVDGGVWIACKHRQDR